MQTTSLPADFRAHIESLFTDADWSIEYLPYTGHDGNEIPNYRIADANGEAVCETNENAPDAVQAAHACLIATAPQLFKALEYFFNIMHDYESSLNKGYIAEAMRQARTALAQVRLSQALA